MGEYVNIQEGKIKELRDKVLNITQHMDFERTTIMMQVYREYEGEPAIIIRAQFLARLLREKKIYIDDNLFVGSIAGTPGGMYLMPEWNVYSLIDGKFEVPEDKKESLQETIDYWKTRCLYYKTGDNYRKTFGHAPDYIRDGYAAEVCSAPAGGGNTNSMLAADIGLRALIDEVKAKRAALPCRLDTSKNRHYYDATEIVLEAIIDYAHRYADLAESLAEKEADPVEKEELLLKAQICRHVPEFPARNLREAMQAFWFIHLAQEIEQVGCSLSPGYLGQRLEPYYDADKAAGKVSYKEAVYMIQHLFAKMNDLNYYYGQSAELTNSNDLGQAVSIGGYDEDGRDATVELDYAILDAQMELQLIQPPLVFFYHSQIKPDFMHKALELVATGCGMPQFMNTDIVVSRSLAAYSKYGATLADARRTCVFGCVTTGISNKSTFIIEANMSLAKPLELLLNNGYDPVHKMQLGLETGDPTQFESFEELYQAYLKQLNHILVDVRNYGRIGNTYSAEVLPLPIRSAFIHGCIERGLDCMNHGADINVPSFVYACGTDAANGLMAIKKLIFDEKKITMAQLREALLANFVGYENIQKMCLDAPKHGNGNKEVEALMQRIYKDAGILCEAEGPDYLGRDMRPDAFSKSVHNHYGMFTGAFPSGRKAGVAFTDGSVSAQAGTEEKGPSVLVTDAAVGIDTIAYNSGHLNVRLVPNQFETEAGYQAVRNMIKGYFDLHGNHIQFNCVKQEDLLDAKAHPENHKDLIVRVAGFSAYFTKLHPGVQDEIIARTQHEVG